MSMSFFRVLLLVLPLVGDVRGAEPNARQTAQKLVAQLGHEEFATRERAAVKLIALGIDGANALVAGMESPDREDSVSGARSCTR